MGLIDVDEIEEQQISDISCRARGIGYGGQFGLRGGRARGVRQSELGRQGGSGRHGLLEGIKLAQEQEQEKSKHATNSKVHSVVRLLQTNCRSTCDMCRKT